MDLPAVETPELALAWDLLMKDPTHYVRLATGHATPADVTLVLQCGINAARELDAQRVVTDTDS